MPIKPTLAELQRADAAMKSGRLFSTSGHRAVALLDALEAAEARIAKAEADLVEMTGQYLDRNSALTFASIRAGKAEAELAAIRGVAVPAGKFAFEPAGKRWMHVKHGEYQYTEPKLPMVKLFTHPAPPVVVLPTRIENIELRSPLEVEDMWLHRITSTLVKAGINVKSADGEG